MLDDKSEEDTITYDDNRTYSGSISKGGLPEGIGKMTYLDGIYLDGVYEGEFKYGEPQTSGILKYTNGDTYQGEFKEGYPSRGKLTYADGATYEGSFKIFDDENGQTRRSLPDGTDGLILYSKNHAYISYRGAFVEGFPQDNQGHIRYRNSDIYLGSVKNGVPSGVGELFKGSPTGEKDKFAYNKKLTGNFSQGFPEGEISVYEKDQNDRWVFVRSEIANKG